MREAIWILSQLFLAMCGPDRVMRATLRYWLRILLNTSHGSFGERNVKS